MKVVIIGGTGLIGRKVASKLQSGWTRGGGGCAINGGQRPSRGGSRRGVDRSERCRRRHELPVVSRTMPYWISFGALPGIC